MFVERLQSDIFRSASNCFNKICSNPECVVEGRFFLRVRYDFANHAFGPWERPAGIAPDGPPMAAICHVCSFNVFRFGLLWGLRWHSQIFRNE